MPLDGARTEVELRCDLRIGATVPGQSSDVLLLRRQLVPAVVVLPHVLARCDELPARALGEPVRGHQDEHVVSGAQLLPSVAAAVLAPQPLAEQKMRARQLRTDRGAAQAIDRLAIELLGRWAVQEERSRARLDTKAPVAVAG